SWTGAAVLAAALGAAGCVGDASTATTDLAVPPASPPPATPPPPDHTAFVAAVDALATDALVRGPVAGLSIAVFSHGEPVLAKGYGLADVESGVPATPETSYPIASVSKHFTAALVLRLAERGLLSLDDPLARFFPDARPQIGALTLRNLLDHTSGLTRGGVAPRTAAQSVLRRGGTARAPGAIWDYSNYNFSLLGLAIEQATGRDYASLVHDELVTPLGLTGTGYCEDGTAVPGRARDYLSGGRRLSPTDDWAGARFFAGGGLCSTVLDLVAFERALEEGRVVSPAMLQAMRASTPLPGGIAAGYGLGTRLGATAGRAKIGHTGGGQGNKAVLARYPAEGLTIAVLFNSERDHAEVTPNELEERIARLFFAGNEAPRADEPPASADLLRYVGQYREGPRLSSVTVDGGMLLLRPGLRDQKQSRLFTAPGGALVSPDDPTVELRFQVADGAPLALSRYRNGWFSGVAVRSAEPFVEAPTRPRARPLAKRGRARTRR
ncbi:MAG: serine hydrolase domain-containing protein, partial [Vicinamibacteria bacterium]